jgi:quercetin dioxygenase-like cupin family protein
MLTIDLNKLDLMEFTAVGNPKQRCKSTFPMLGAHGSKNSAAVYVELDPSEELGTHTDSAEETLIVLEGTVEVQVGDETAKATKGSMVLVPEMVSHNFKNIGTDKVKVLGFFGGANNIVATFENTWMPTESNTVDTSAIAG